jgi:hypothetical protein
MRFRVSAGRCPSFSGPRADSGRHRVGQAADCREQRDPDQLARAGTWPKSRNGSSWPTGRSVGDSFIAMCSALQAVSAFRLGLRQGHASISLGTPAGVEDLGQLLAGLERGRLPEASRHRMMDLRSHLPPNASAHYEKIRRPGRRVEDGRTKPVITIERAQDSLSPRPSSTVLTSTIRPTRLVAIRACLATHRRYP